MVSFSLYLLNSHSYFPLKNWNIMYETHNNNHRALGMLSGGNEYVTEFQFSICYVSWHYHLLSWQCHESHVLLSQSPSAGTIGKISILRSDGFTDRRHHHPEQIKLCIWEWQLQCEMLREVTFYWRWDTDIILAVGTLGCGGLGVRSNKISVLCRTQSGFA